MTTDRIRTKEKTLFMETPESDAVDVQTQELIEQEAKSGLSVFLEEHLQEEEMKSLIFRRLTINTNYRHGNSEYKANLDYSNGGSLYTMLSQHNSNSQPCADAHLLVVRSPKTGSSNGASFIFEMKRTAEGNMTKEIWISPLGAQKATEQFILTLTDDGVLLSSSRQAMDYVKEMVPWIDIALLVNNQEYRKEIVEKLRRGIFLDEWPEEP